jgi:hypothetical protein
MPPLNFNYQQPTTLRKSDTTTGYSRTAVLCYLWQIKLVEEDTQVQRFYDSELEETCFTVTGLPTDSRPQKFWKEGQEGFGAKLQHNLEGTVAKVFLKGDIAYSSQWELDIISPITTGGL